MRTAGFHTMDSGDGSNHAAGMECAVPFRMVFVGCRPSELAAEADRLAEWVTSYGLDWPAFSIQASYNPADGVAGIILGEVAGEAADYREGITGVRPSGMV